MHAMTVLKIAHKRNECFFWNNLGLLIKKSQYTIHWWQTLLTL